MPLRRIVWPSLLALALAGCASTGPPMDPVLATGETATMPAAVQWSQSGNVTLGWIAAAGANTYLGDHDVGLTSHEQCPHSSFYVPPSTTALGVTWDVPNVDPEGMGAGLYELAISNPQEIWYLTPPLAGTGMDVPGPPAGIWQLDLIPQGAAANLAWTLQFTLAGTGPAPEPLVFYPSGDCLL